MATFFAGLVLLEILSGALLVTAAPLSSSSPAGSHLVRRWMPPPPPGDFWQSQLACPRPDPADQELAATAEYYGAQWEKAGTNAAPPPILTRRGSCFSRDCTDTQSNDDPGQLPQTPPTESSPAARRIQWDMRSPAKYTSILGATPPFEHTEPPATVQEAACMVQFTAVRGTKPDENIIDFAPMQLIKNARYHILLRFEVKPAGIEFRTRQDDGPTSVGADYRLMAFTRPHEDRNKLSVSLVARENAKLIVQVRFRYIPEPVRAAMTIFMGQQDFRRAGAENPTISEVPAVPENPAIEQLPAPPNPMAPSVRKKPAVWASLDFPASMAPAAPKAPLAADVPAGPAAPAASDPGAGPSPSAGPSNPTGPSNPAGPNVDPNDPAGPWSVAGPESSGGSAEGSSDADSNSSW